VDCWSPVHYALLGVSLCTAVPFLVIIPWFLHRIIVQHTVFNQPPLHEKHVRSREIEYMIGVSDLYEQDRTFVFASYRRYFVYSPVRDGYLCGTQLIRSDFDACVIQRSVQFGRHPVCHLTQFMYPIC